jgi:Alr-MurF fusion protein
MHRLGFVADDISLITEVLEKEKNIEIASVFSHLVGADEALHNNFSEEQIRNFSTLTTQLCSDLKIKPLRHILNSAGILRFPEARYDMVRLGIGLYGIEVSEIEPDMVEPIGVFKSTISQVKTLNPGETVGYGRKGKIEKLSKIATVAVGYADGYDRRFSNGVGEMLVNGSKCKVIGNVCMDMTMIDVSDVDCQEGDTVIIFGESLSIKDMASRIGTIPYELLTGISERVKRVFFYE